MFSHTEARGYRVLINIIEKSRPGAIMPHEIIVPAYDVTDALVQASFEAVRQGLVDPHDQDFDVKIVHVQPQHPPYSTLTGSVRGPLDERLAAYLNSKGY